MRHARKKCRPRDKADYFSMPTLDLEKQNYNVFYYTLCAKYAGGKEY